MQFGTWAGIGMIGGLLVYIIWQMGYRKKSIDQMLVGNISLLFKLLGAGSTAGEVYNLMEIAMDERGYTLGAAFSRFGWIGIIEVLCTIIFMSVIANGLKKAAEDGVITVFEYAKIVVFSTPAFLIGFFCTSYIHILYLESINHIEFIQSEGPWRLLPILGMEIIDAGELNTDGFPRGSVLEDWKIQIEGSAVFLIYTTPLINIAMIYFTWKKVKMEMANGGITSGGGGGNINPTVLPGSIKANLPKLRNYFGFDEAGFEKWLGEYIGMDMTSKVMVNTTRTHPDVKSKKIQPMAALKEITGKILGKVSTKRSPHPTGVRGIEELGTKIHKLLKKIDKIVSDLNGLNTRKTSLENAGKSIANINVNIKGKEGEREKEKIALMKLHNEREDVKDDLKGLLVQHNFHGCKAGHQDDLSSRVAAL